MRLAVSLAEESKSPALANSRYSLIKSASESLRSFAAFAASFMAFLASSAACLVFCQACTNSIMPLTANMIHVIGLVAIAANAALAFAPTTFHEKACVSFAAVCSKEAIIICFCAAVNLLEFRISTIIAAVSCSVVLFSVAFAIFLARVAAVALSVDAFAASS